MKLNELNEDDKMKDKEEKRNYYISLLDFYKRQKKKIHVEVDNGRFYNGFVVEILDDAFILEDSSLGQMPIFFSQIKIVEGYKEKGGDK